VLTEISDAGLCGRISMMVLGSLIPSVGTVRFGAMQLLQMDVRGSPHKMTRLKIEKIHANEARLGFFFYADR
jgi:hypothetical protein